MGVMLTRTVTGGVVAALLVLGGACEETSLSGDDTAPDAAWLAVDGGPAPAADASASPPTPPPQADALEVVPTEPMDVVDPRRGPPYPLVLVHGLNGFRDLGPVDYFFRVPAGLEEAGLEAYVTAVAPYDGTPQRSLMLKAEIDRILLQSGARKVNVVAHSQGGLDTRYLISTLGYGDRVATLTTVSTPHRGTRVADALLDHQLPLQEELLNAYAFLFGEASGDAQNDPNARASLETLSEAHAAAFNRANPDDPRVAYFSFAGRTNLQRAEEQCQGEWPNPEAVDAIEPALLATWVLLAQDLLHPQASDGLVAVSSARWGRFMSCLPADHADEIGQLADLFPELISGWDHVAFYVGWAQHLRSLGF
jgi:triacylglycerol lipase